MACGMCESHINDAVRKAFDKKIKKVSSSKSKKRTEVISDEPVDEELLRKTIADTGYTVGEIHTEPYEKKGLFGLFG